MDYNRIAAIVAVIVLIGGVCGFLINKFFPETISEQIVVYAYIWTIPIVLVIVTPVFFSKESTSMSRINCFRWHLVFFSAVLSGSLSWLYYSETNNEIINPALFFVAGIVLLIFSFIGAMLLAFRSSENRKCRIVFSSVFFFLSVITVTISYFNNNSIDLLDEYGSNVSKATSYDSLSYAPLTKEINRKQDGRKTKSALSKSTNEIPEGAKRPQTKQDKSIVVNGYLKITKKNIHALGFTLDDGSTINSIDELRAKLSKGTFSATLQQGYQVFSNSSLKEPDMLCVQGEKVRIQSPIIGPTLDGMFKIKYTLIP